MMRFLALAIVLVLTLAAVAVAQAQETIQLRFGCFEEGNECAVYADLLSRFSAKNADIQVTVEVASQSEILSSADPPDIARIADIQALQGGYLDLRPLIWNPDAPEAAFRSLYFAALRGDDESDAIHGYPDSLGMVAPFVNTSAFEAANVALPGEEANWDEWLAALAAVAEISGAPYVLAVDNKDHRFAGPAMSLGALYFDEAGDLALPDDAGLRYFVHMLSDLRAAGKTPDDTLLGAGKSESYFVRGEALMYICGSWKAQSVARQVGDAFEWVIAPSPRGPAGGSAIATATFVVALADTQHPAAVARVFDFLANPATIAEFAARALIVPAREGVASAEIEYDTDDKAVAAALNAFARQVATMSDQALALDLHPMAAEYYAASNQWLRAYFAGEFTLDEAMTGLREALREAATMDAGASR